MGAVTLRPWGISRMAPYPTLAPGYATATLDPDTQTAVFRDGFGRVLDMGKHNTSTGTSPTTGTSPDGNGQGSTDSDTGSDSDQ
ncbi:putative ATP-grasp-modified RiPP [Streptomyces humi]